MATEDIYSGVNWTDGEEIAAGDLNDGQRFLSARLFDQVIAKLIGSSTSRDPEFESQQGADPSTAWAYALTVGGGNPKQGSTNAKVKIGAGTLLQKIANASGAEPQLLAYTFSGTEEVTIAAGDATNPRVDMIQMALSYVTDDPQSRDFQDAVTGANTSQSVNKKRRVQCVLNVKQGVAAASPVYPTPDAGAVPIACVVVGATYAAAAALKYVDTAGAVAVLHDVRMPISVRPHRIVNPFPKPLPRVLGTLLSSDNPQGTGGTGPANTHLRDSGKWIFVASVNPIYYPIEFAIGDVIASYSIAIQKADTMNAAAAHLAHSDAAGDTDDSAGSTSGTAAGLFALAESPRFALVAGNAYSLKVTPGGTVNPNPDYIFAPTIYVKHIGDAGAIVMPCAAPRGRLIAVAVTSASGSATANTSRLAAEVPGVGSTYLADISAIAETGGTPTRHGMRMSDIEAAAEFTAGPVVQGNGTHAPPIWGNGKRCYEEALNLGAGACTPSRLSARFEYPTTAIDVYDTTFYMAEGL